ncbi:MAG: hypothetical protein ACK4NS_02210 [Saprospiraceae bacterium]
MIKAPEQRRPNSITEAGRRMSAKAMSFFCQKNRIFILFSAKNTKQFIFFFDFGKSQPKTLQNSSKNRIFAEIKKGGRP